MLIMPASSVVHYKSAFDIVFDGAVAMEKVQNVIFEWLRKHPVVGDGLIRCYHGWFKSGTTKQVKIGAGYFRVAVNNIECGIDNPENWTIEFIHKDSHDVCRLWCTIISLSKIDENSVRLACLLKYAVSEGWIGDIPGDPHFSVPGVIKCIISIFNCKKNDMKLQSKISECYVGDISVLAKYILDKTRVIPLVVSASCQDGRNLVDLDKLHKIILGNANMYYLNGDDVDAINYYIPTDICLKRGMLRVYSSVAFGVMAMHHRYYTEERVAMIGEEKVLWQVGVGLARNSRTFKTDDLLSISDTVNLSTVWRHRRLKEKHVTSVDELSFYKDILKEKEDEVALLTLELDDCKCESDQYAAMYDKIERQYNDAKNSLVQYRYAKNTNTESVDTGCISRLPNSIEDVLSMLSVLLKDRIIVHEKAYDSAANFAGNDEAVCINAAWKMIYEIGTTLHDMYFNSCRVDIVKEFKDKTGIEVALSESSQTQADRNLMKLRQCVYRGQCVDFSPHVKGGRREMYMRIHYSKIDSERKLLVCYCGEHLPTYGTQRQ